MANGTPDSTFPGVDPQKLAMVRAMVQASQGDTSGIPQMPTGATSMPATPSPLGPTSPFDLASNLKTISQIPQVAQPISQMQDVYSKLQNVQQEQQKLGVPQEQGGYMPKMGFQPSYKPHSFLHNLGQALLSVAASTTPGRAVQQTIYGPGISRYEALRDTLEKQRETLEQEAGIPKAQLGAESGLAQAGALSAYRGGELGVKQQLADVAKQKADSYQQSVQNHLNIALKNLDIKGILAGSTVALNNAKIVLNNVMSQVLPERLDVERYGIDVNSTTRQAIMNAETQLGMQKEHPLLNLFDSTFGTSLTPAAPQAPGGAQPVGGATPLPPRTATPKTPNRGGSKKEVVKF